MKDHITSQAFTLGWMSSSKSFSLLRQVHFCREPCCFRRPLPKPLPRSWIYKSSLWPHRFACEVDVTLAGALFLCDMLAGGTINWRPCTCKQSVKLCIPSKGQRICTHVSVTTVLGALLQQCCNIYNKALHCTSLIQAYMLTTRTVTREGYLQFDRACSQEEKHAAAYKISKHQLLTCVQHVHTGCMVIMSWFGTQSSASPSFGVTNSVVNRTR